VSPLWSKRLIIGLLPHGIVVRNAAAPKSQGSSLAYWPNAFVDESVSWRDSVATLQRWLTENSPKRARLDIIISDRYVRYLVLPWSSDLTQDEEWLALARARIDVTWGQAEAREVRIDRPRFKSTCFACAIDQDLHARLLSLQLPPGLKIQAVRPNFTATFNELRADITAAPTLVVVGERDSVTIGAIENNQWRHVRSLPTTGGDQEAVGRLVERERMLLGLPADVSVIQRLVANLPAQSGVAVQ
jgi:hypothetical protein